MNQCLACQNDKKEKLYSDMAHCSNPKKSNNRNYCGNKIRHLWDTICEDCAYQENRCRTCGNKFEKVCQICNNTETPKGAKLCWVKTSKCSEINPDQLDPEHPEHECEEKGSWICQMFQHDTRETHSYWCPIYESIFLNMVDSPEF